MGARVKKHHPALKHGGYAAATILPGESAADFEKLHQQLIAEFAPNGVFEDDIIASLAKLLWRKQNLAAFRIAEFARRRYEERIYDRPRGVQSFERRSEIELARHEARELFGSTCEFVEIDEPVIVDCLMNELAVHDRLDAMVDKCLKRLLFVRGLKSISAASSSAPPKPVAGPSRSA